MVDEIFNDDAIEQIANNMFNFTAILPNDLDFCWIKFCLFRVIIRPYFQGTGHPFLRRIIDKDIYSNKLFKEVNLPTIYGKGGRRIENGRKY